MGENQIANLALMILITGQSHSSSVNSYFGETSSPFLSPLFQASMWAVSHMAGLYTAKSVSLIMMYRGKNDKIFHSANVEKLTENSPALFFHSFSVINPLVMKEEPDTLPLSLFLYLFTHNPGSLQLSTDGCYI